MLWAEHVAKNTARKRDDVYAEAKQHFTDAELVELTGVCGLFALLNRFQDSLHLPIEDPHVIDRIRRSARVDHNRIRDYIGLLIENWPARHPVQGGAVAARANSEPAALLAIRESCDRNCRIPLPEPEAVRGDTERFYAAIRALIGGIPNFARIWADIPYAGMLALPFHLALEREGAGGMLPTVLKAAVMIRTSHLNDSPYGLAHYVAIGGGAGLDDARIDALLRPDAAAYPGFTPRERAAIQWADLVVTNSAKRNETAFAAIQPLFNGGERVELTVLCVATSMVNRICNALRIPLEPEPEFAALHQSLRLEPARLKEFFVSLYAGWPSAMPLPDPARA